GVARLEDAQADADLRKVRLGLEGGPAGERHAVPALRAADPPRLARVDDEPALARGHEPRLGLLERRLGNHERIVTAPYPVKRSRSGRRASRSDRRKDSGGAAPG